ncbi:MAG: tetratricopeptide repeat protein [Elusimicrobiota bacterium]
MLGFALLAGLLAAPVRAGGVPRDEVDRLYFHRDQGANLADSISALDDLIKSDGSPDLYWRRCRSLIRRGELRGKKSDKLADYDLARQDCEKSVALSSGSADAHFWYGVAMGRWGEAKGIFKALFLIKPIRREMAATLALDPNHGGAHRVLGEMLWQIPGFAGGDKKAAIAEYETAVRLGPNHSTNYPVLAEAYLHFDRKDDAIRTLKAVAEIKNPDDPAEYPGDLVDAQKLLAKLTK